MGKTIHGGKGTRLYRIWKAMKTRCYNPNNAKYKNCAKNGHICVAEEMQGKLCGKNKDKWELRR